MAIDAPIMTPDEIRKTLADERYPMAAKYDPDWIFENKMGDQCLWNLESLCRKMELKPGMRVLDMGCGKAVTSIFIAKEFGVQVFANDLWIDPTENWKRVREAGVHDLVYPIKAEAHSLPYAEEFFDAVVFIIARTGGGGCSSERGFLKACSWTTWTATATA